jgi:signal transduction histidine kinase
VLHDSVQQRLIALAVELQLARSLVEEEPGEAVRLLDEARAGVGKALDDIRAVAQRIHPPLLDTQGLMAALRMAAAATPFASRVEGSVEARVPPGVAVTVYRCCVAALAAVDGADSIAAALTVGARGDVLAFAIDVEGGRMDAASLDGVAGRVRLFGGTLDVAANRVAGSVPLTTQHRPPPDT